VQERFGVNESRVQAKLSGDSNVSRDLVICSHSKREKPEGMSVTTSQPGLAA